MLTTKAMLDDPGPPKWGTKMGQAKLAEKRRGTGGRGPCQDCWVPKLERCALGSNQNATSAHQKKGHGPPAVHAALEGINAQHTVPQEGAGGLHLGDQGGVALAGGWGGVEWGGGVG